MEMSFAARLGPIEPLRQLLVDVLGRLARGQQASLHPRHEELAGLVERVQHLEDGPLADLEHAAVTLRGPLVALRSVGSTQQELTKEQRLMLRNVLRALGALIENVELGASSWRLGSDQLAMAYSEVDFSRLAESVCAPFEDIARERRLDWRLELVDELRAEVDERKVQHVLLNLLFNAVKYTPVGGAVRVTVDLDDVEDEIVCAVEDSGAPIPRAQREEIFDRSRQLDRSIFLRTSGAGLNLGASRDLVALHGGTLVSAPGSLGGACFRARIPRLAPDGVRVGHGRPADQALPEKIAALAAAELREEAELERRSPDEGRRPLVLIVEDSRSVQRILVQSLQPDCATASAVDADDGLKKAIALRPDLIVLDSTMPGLDGKSLARALRGRPELGEVPILVLTAANDPFSQVELLEAGVQDVLRKPFLLPEARARIKNLLTAKQTLDVLNSVAAHHDTDPLRLAADISRHQRELRAALEQVEVARDLAERASQTKSNFLRMMSHELRTPVTAMHLHIHVLKQDPDVASSQKLRDGFDRINQSSQRLLQLVNTILEWARVESNRVTLTIEELDLHAIARETVSSMADYAKRKKPGLVFEEHDEAPGLPLMSDRRLVSLIAMNLLTRAVQSTEKGTVTVRVHREGDQHLLSVRDGGSRITPKLLDELFEPLASTKDLRWQGGGGSGLGLFVVRDLARAIDADIGLEPWDEVGNTFTVRFPTLPARGG
jgi:signal transduction histidine kinase